MLKSRWRPDEHDGIATHGFRGPDAHRATETFLGSTPLPLPPPPPPPLPPPPPCFLIDDRGSGAYCGFGVVCKRGTCSRCGCVVSGAAAGAAARGDQRLRDQWTEADFGAEHRRGGRIRGGGGTGEGERGRDSEEERLGGAEEREEGERTEADRGEGRIGFGDKIRGFGEGREGFVEGIEGFRDAIGGFGGLGAFGGLEAFGEGFWEGIGGREGFWEEFGGREGFAEGLAGGEERNRTKFSWRQTMGQRLARHQVERGVRLYNEQKQDQAVCKWKKSLRKITKNTERFMTLGYLCQAYCDWGKYREMLDFAFQMLDVANEACSPNMRGEAYLNLARGNEFLSEYFKAMTYCRHAIFNYCDESRITGYVHLCLANSYLGYSNFCKAIECFDVAIKIAKEIRDAVLEIQAILGLGNVFAALCDHEKATRIYGKAYDLVKEVRGSAVYAKYLRLTLVRISSPLRKLGKVNEAYACCEDAMKMALRVKDRPIQARCLQGFADIYRTRSDVDRAYSTYEVAYGLWMEIGDKSGQVDVLAGMSKTLALMTRLGRVCNCKALEVNSKVLDLASGLGCKMSMYWCHARMRDIYRSLGDKENERREDRLAWSVMREMDLTCGICDKEYGIATNRLEALPCAHIFHANCVQDVLKDCERKHTSRECPYCQKSLNSRTFLISYEELESSCPYISFLDDPL